MRVREKSYSDHGMTDEEVRHIYDYCREATEAEIKIIKQALAELQPYLQKPIFDSLVNNMSYEDLCAKEYLYIGKGDFYGHRREGMAAIKRWLILYNLWEIQ